MKLKWLGIVSMLLFGLMSCDLKKKEEISRRTIDSLKNELTNQAKITEAMVEVGNLLDTIDASRKVLRTTMLEGTTYDHYAERMKDINEYVKKTEERMATLEKTARKSRNNSSSYTAAIKKLRGELNVANLELTALKEQVEMYRNENESLVNTVSLQKAEIEDKLNLIKTNQEENAKLEEQVQVLITKSKQDEGEAYFARAEAASEIARRTQFAPKKKKSARREALELYKLALTFGKTEAEPKIAALEAKL